MDLRVFFGTVCASSLNNDFLNDGVMTTRRLVDCAMECCCYLRNVHDRMTDCKTALRNDVVRNLMDHQSLRNIGGLLMMGDCEELQESEAVEIYVKRFKTKKLCVKEHFRISVCKRNSKTSWSSKAHPQQRRETLSEKMMLKSKKTTKREAHQKIRSSSAEKLSIDITKNLV